MKRAILLVFLFLTFSLFAACSSEKDNTLPPSPLVSFKPSLKVNQLWVANAGSGSSKYYLRLTPAADNGKIFTSSYNGQICATDAKTGQLVWRTDVDANVVSGVGAGGGKLFIGTEDGRVVALNQTSGKILWQATSSNQVLAAPNVSNGIVLVKSIDGTLTALSADDGHRLWRLSHQVPNMVLRASSQPEISGKKAVVGFANGMLECFDLPTGKPYWSIQIATPEGANAVERMVDIDVNPVIVRGVVYIATYQGKIAALSMKNGHVIWMHKISSYSGIAASPNNVYISDAQSKVWSFSNSFGGINWRQSDLTGRNITGPALLGSYVAVVDGLGYLHWMAKSDGRFVCRNKLDDSGATASPIVYKNRLYVYTQSGSLFAFSL